MNDRGLRTAGVGIDVPTPVGPQTWLRGAKLCQNAFQTILVVSIFGQLFFFAKIFRLENLFTPFWSNFGGWTGKRTSKSNSSQFFALHQPSQPGHLTATAINRSIESIDRSYRNLAISIEAIEGGQEMLSSRSSSHRNSVRNGKVERFTAPSKF